MAKKIILNQQADPTAAIVPDVPRDVKAEQGYQEAILNAQAQRQQGETTKASQEQAEATRRLQAAQAATERMLQEEQQAQMKTPLSPAERARMKYLERLAMQSGNRPPEIMHELAFLRQRSNVSATA